MSSVPPRNGCVAIFGGVGRIATRLVSVPQVTDEKNYLEEMKTSGIEKARREKESEMKAQEKKRLEEKIASLEKSKKHTNDELGAVEQYLKAGTGPSSARFRAFPHAHKACCSPRLRWRSEDYMC